MTSLIYRIECENWVDYNQAISFEREEPGFRVKVEDAKVRIELKERYPTIDEAQRAVEQYIQAWNVSSCCTLGPNYFRLEFEKAIYEPGPQPVRLRAELQASGLSNRTNYPKPPSNIVITPDVESMYQRYMGYHTGREPLPGMAYFCLTVLQMAGGGRKQAAEKYQIDIDVLNKVGELTSTRSGVDARKASSATELTDEERFFLEETVKRMILRAAEKACNPESDLEKISLSVLPPI